MFSNEMSIAKITMAKINEATITTTVEFCNCANVGRSLYEPIRYKILLRN